MDSKHKRHRNLNQNTLFFYQKITTDLEAHYNEVSLFTIPPIFGWCANEIRCYCITIVYEISKRSPTSCYLLHTLHNVIHLKFHCSTLSIPCIHSLYMGNESVLHRNCARNVSVLPKKWLDINCSGFRQDFSYYFWNPIVFSMGFHNGVSEYRGILFTKSHWYDMEIIVNLARQILIG